MPTDVTVVKMTVDIANGAENAVVHTYYDVNGTINRGYKPIEIDLTAEELGLKVQTEYDVDDLHATNLPALP